jgi:hypothetical protein
MVILCQNTQKALGIQYSHTNIFPENNVCQRQLDLPHHFHSWEIWNPEIYNYVGKRSSKDKI